MKLKKPNIVLEYIKGHWLRYVLCLFFIAIIVILYNSLKESFTSKIFYSDGLFIAGGLLVGYGLLIIVNYFGAFNIFQMMFNRKIVNGRREQLYEFTVRKQEERKVGLFSFVDFFIVGFLCIIIAWLLLKI